MHWMDLQLKQKYITKVDFKSRPLPPFGHADFLLIRAWVNNVFLLTWMECFCDLFRNQYKSTSFNHSSPRTHTNFLSCQVNNCMSFDSSGSFCPNLSNLESVVSVEVQLFWALFDKMVCMIVCLCLYT